MGASNTAFLEPGQNAATTDPEDVRFYHAPKIRRAINPFGFDEAETTLIEGDRDLYERVVNRLRTQGESVPLEALFDAEKAES